MIFVTKIISKIITYPILNNLEHFAIYSAKVIREINQNSTRWI